MSARFDPSLSESPSSPSTLPTPSSATFSDALDQHPHPSVPSTFLPSYYPDSRDRLPLPSEIGRGRNNPEQRSARHSMPSAQDFDSTRIRHNSHSAAEVDRISAAGPSTRHLLDGVDLDHPPRPSRPTDDTPAYDLEHEAYSRPLSPGSLATRHMYHRGEWNELPFDAQFPDAMSGGSGNGDGPGLGPGSRIGFGASNGSRPEQIRPQISNLATNHPSSYSTPNSISPTSAAVPTDTNATSTMLVECEHAPNPNANQNPGSRYHSASVKEEPEKAISPEDYAKAHSIYTYLLHAVNHILPLSREPTTKGLEFESLVQLAHEGQHLVAGLGVPGLSVEAAAARKTHDAYRQAQSESGPADYRTSAPPPPHQPPPGEHVGTPHHYLHLPPRQPSPVPRKSAKRQADHKSKVPTKCLGCGATETPEWRRGPLGPRTLCNACVSALCLSLHILFPQLTPGSGPYEAPAQKEEARGKRRGRASSAATVNDGLLRDARESQRKSGIVRCCTSVSNYINIIRSKDDVASHHRAFWGCRCLDIMYA